MGVVPLESGIDSVMEESIAEAAGMVAGTDDDDEARRQSLAERALAIVQGDLEAARTHQVALSAVREENYRYYRAMSLGNEREGRSSVVSSDVMDAIEWMMPSLMRIYFSGDIVSCEPIGPEDVERAERVEALLNYQFQRRGNGFTVCYKWFKDALLYGLGFVKTTWEDRFKPVSFLFEEMDEDAFNDLRSRPDCEVHSYAVEEVPPGPEVVNQVMQAALASLPPGSPQEAYVAYVDEILARIPPMMIYRSVKGIREVLDYSGPCYEAIPPEDMLYDPAAEDMDQLRFAIHRVYRSPDYLRRMEATGVYSNVEEALESSPTTRGVSDEEMEKRERYAEEGRLPGSDLTSGIAEAEKRTPVEVFEWWGLFDPDDDGRMEPYVITMANDIIIRCERNPYEHGEPPFEALRPILDVHKFEGISIPDLVKEFQATKTSLRRQILDNISWQNNGMWEVLRAGGVEIESLVAPRPGGVVRVDVQGSIRPLTPPPIQQAAYMALEFEQTQLEQRTGVTRYNQGLHAKTLNSTATGITAIMGASQQRIELIARLFAETGMKRLFSKSLSLNRQFLRQDFTMRLYNEPVTISPDDVSGQFDILVSVGIAAGKSEAMQQQLLQLIQMGPSLSQAGVMSPDNIYEIVKKLLQGWGFKDFQKYTTNPQFFQQMNEMQGQLQQMQSQMTEMGTVLNDPRIKPLADAVAQEQESRQQMQAQNMAMGGTGQMPLQGGMEPQGAPGGPPQGLPPELLAAMMARGGGPQ